MRRRAPRADGLGHPAQAESSVNTATGNYVYSRTDIAMGGPGVQPLSFRRTYDSHDTRVGPLGIGWTHDFFRRVGQGEHPDFPGSLVVAGPQGRTDRYIPLGGGQFQPHVPAVNATFVQHPDGTYTLAESDRTAYSFDGIGRLTRIAYPNGQESRLSYNPRGQLISVGDPGGRGALRFAYDPATQRLVSVSDWLDPPRVVRFTYDDATRLSGVIDREGHLTRYTYHAEGNRLATIEDAIGHVALRVDYDEQGRAWQRWDSLGHLRDLSWQDLPDGTRLATHTYPPSSFEPGWRTTIDDLLGERGALLRRTTYPSSADDPLVEDSSYPDDAGPRITTRSGGVVPPPPWAADPTDPEAGPPAEPRLASPSAAPPLRLSSPRGVPPEDSADMLQSSGRNPYVAIYRAMGLASGAPGIFPPEVTYDTTGRLTGLTMRVLPVVPALGNRWTFEYDRESRPRFVNGPGGQRTEYRWDAVGNLREVVPPDGAAIRLAYEERDSLADIQWPSGARAQYAYDERGDILHATLTPADGTGQERLEYRHDGLNRLRKVTTYPSWPDQTSATETDYAYDDRGSRTAYTRTIEP